LPALHLLHVLHGRLVFIRIELAIAVLVELLGHLRRNLHLPALLPRLLPRVLGLRGGDRDG
jgi:hypothetical protein